MPTTAPDGRGGGRALDVVGASVGLLVLWPLMVLIGAVVRLTSPGPALYRGERVGRGERRYRIWKFRTMRVGAEAQIGGRLVQPGEAVFTPVGPFLRRFRLDELPQLVNVLRGEMSLVGPRPVRPVFVERWAAEVPGYRRRFSVRPGITGLAQVRGGYYTRPRHKLMYEVLYLSRRTVWLDLVLIALTGVRLATRVFSTTLLLCWLWVVVLLLPGAVQRVFLVSVGGVEVNALYLVPLLTVGVHLLRKRVERSHTTVLRSPVDGALGVFLAVSLAAGLLGPDGWAGLRGWAWYVCNGAVVMGLVLHSRMVTTARGALVAALVGATAAVGVVDLAARGWAAWQGAGFGRVAGTLSPLPFATVAVLMLPLAVARARRSAGWWVAVACLAAALGGTGSRAGFVAAGLALWVAAPGRRAAAGVALAGLIAVGGWWAAGDGRMSPRRAVADLAVAVERQGATLAALDADPMLDGWRVTGVGPRVLARLRQAGRPVGPALDQMYLTLWVEHGPLGLLAFGWLLFGGVAVMLRTRVADAAAAADLRAVAGGLVGGALMLAVCDGLYALPVTVAFWAALGLGVGLVVQYRAGPRASYRLVRRRDPL